VDELLRAIPIVVTGLLVLPDIDVAFACRRGEVTELSKDEHVRDLFINFSDIFDLDYQVTCRHAQGALDALSHALAAT
jgi:hypothetical protein